ncbi:tocopherol cyclase family protein [Candidatus Solirubrobacter pratensis]|uniref:tocopherol cyclase family protein n=1 Tax=Candidatus Solirubrobacter pratensis TaxID=1298857 RepID=UPI000420DD5C|nr:tocopherol cyclase family protein [Candidatus Solirubrobacter pratensis]
MICGVCRDARGEWAMVTLCAEPGGFECTEIAEVARADRRGLGVVAGDAAGGDALGAAGGDARATVRGDRAAPILRAGPDGLDVRLRGATLRARFSARRDWPRRAFGALGPAQVVPGLGQYWTPHLLSATVGGDARLGDRTLSLDGAAVYGEKNWGAAFAAHWWWGQAAFEEGAGAAFAGGRLGAGGPAFAAPLRRLGASVAPTAVAVWTPGGLVALAPPFARTVARASGGEWHIAARSPRHRVELRGEASGPPLRLPVPVPAERRLEARSEHHLAGRLQVTVHRGRRLWLRADSGLAGLEDGRPG